MGPTLGGEPRRRCTPDTVLAHGALQATEAWPRGNREAEPTEKPTEFEEQPAVIEPEPVEVLAKEEPRPRGKRGLDDALRTLAEAAEMQRAIAEISERRSGLRVLRSTTCVARPRRSRTSRRSDEQRGNGRAVDPPALIVASNVRSDTKVTKEFVASVKLHVVLVPITAQNVDGELRVTDGQRRTLAAVEAELSEAPVNTVVPLQDAARIVDQVVVKEHRESPDQVERVLALKELEHLGVSAAAIAKLAGTQRKAVDGALPVGGSGPALAAMWERQLSFDAAIAIGEFDDDPGAQARVIQVNGTSYTLRQERSRRDRAKLTAELEARNRNRPAVARLGRCRAGYVALHGFEAVDIGWALPADQIVERAGDGLRVISTYD